MAARGSRDVAATRTVRVRRGGVLFDVEMPVVESRFLVNFREPATDAPGLILDDDGAVWLVHPDGTRTDLSSGGGGGLPTGWSIDDPFVGDFLYDANSRTINLGPAGDPTDDGSGLHLEMVCISETTVELFGGPGHAYLGMLSNTGGQIVADTQTGITSQPDADDQAAFTAGGGAAVALDANGLRVIAVGDPTQDTDAVNKEYVDGRIGIFSVSIGGPGAGPWQLQARVIAQPMDPVNLVWGGYQDSIVIPPTLILATGAVMQYNPFEVDRIDTRHDAYDISVTIIVSNAAATEVLRLAGSAIANGDSATDSADIPQAGLNATAVAGSDLGYDPDTGIVTSNGGGTYAVVATFTGNWD